MARIHRLDDDVVNKIAAGEVVERPASVVKELVENALDAGASRIEVEIEDGGRRLIRVVDDGQGMGREDALAALERHATSKLRDAEGLFSISSFGFRGEAVPAIASVSRLTLLTREAEAVEGTRIEVEGGTMRLCEPAGAPRGTSFVVRDLFFATPARRKFLKRAETEASHIHEAIARLALARPDVSFHLRSGGRSVLRTQATGDLRERIAATIGNDVHPHLLEVDLGVGACAVRGWIASPNWSAPTGRAIYLFVDGRFVRDRQLLHALRQAFGPHLPDGRFPCAVIFVDLPPGQVDVNVHPQKTEVRFADPRGAYEAVYRAVGDALRKGDWLRPAPEEERAPPASGGGEAPSFRGAPPSAAGGIDWHARARASALRADSPLAREAAQALWPREGDAERATEPSAGFFSSLRHAGHLAARWLLCEAPPGELVILDLHAARERVFLADLQQARAAGAITGQPFLFPATVDLPLQEARGIAAHLRSLGALGLEIEPFGGTTFALKAVPPLLVGCDHAAVLTALGATLAEAGSFEAAADRLLAILACHGASRIQGAPTEDEARALLAALDREGGVGAIHPRVVASRLGADALESAS